MSRLIRRCNVRTRRCFSQRGSGVVMPRSSRSAFSLSALLSADLPAVSSPSMPVSMCGNDTTGGLKSQWFFEGIAHPKAFPFGLRPFPHAVGNHPPRGSLQGAVHPLVCLHHPVLNSVQPPVPFRFSPRFVLCQRNNQIFRFCTDRHPLFCRSFPLFPQGYPQLYTGLRTTYARRAPLLPPLSQRHQI